jgi:hypothetical protein
MLQNFCCASHKISLDRPNRSAYILVMLHCSKANTGLHDHFKAAADRMRAALERSSQENIG